MSHAIPPNGAALGKSPEDAAGRGRILTACGLLASLVLAVAAANLDWNEGAAMALGQLAGMVAPLAMLVIVIWRAAVVFGRRA